MGFKVKKGKLTMSKNMGDKLMGSTPKDNTVYGKAVPVKKKGK